MIIMQGVPKKVQTECFCNHIAQAQSPVAGMPFVWKLCFGFGCFLLRQSRIKHSQVISMEKFRPTVLSFGKGIFFSGSYFILGHPVEGEDHNSQYDHGDHDDRESRGDDVENVLTRLLGQLWNSRK